MSLDLKINFGFQGAVLECFIGPSLFCYKRLLRMLLSPDITNNKIFICFIYYRIKRSVRPPLLFIKFYHLIIDRPSHNQFQSGRREIWIDRSS
jgi:hypothetical protein